MPHDVTDLQQQIGVNPPPLKKFVHVLTGITQLGGQPGDGAALLTQLRLDKMSDVGFFVHGLVPVRQQLLRENQKAEPPHSFTTHSRLRQEPQQLIGHETVHA